MRLSRIIGLTMLVGLTVLAGLAAESAQEMVAARIALADVPLKRFLSEMVIPYEADEVTRLIVDAHDFAAFATISSLRATASAGAIFFVSPL